MVRGRPLSALERELIAVGVGRRLSARQIGKWIGRHYSVVSREIARNGGCGEYRAVTAQQRAERNGRRPKPYKLWADRRLHDAVNDGLGKKWSPAQISARLRVEYPDDGGMRVSHEAIYRALFLQARGLLRTELRVALRTGRSRRVGRSAGADGRGRIRDMVLISDRPATAEDRAVPGFWEGDLIIGKDRKSQIATLVERTTRYVLLVRVPYDRSAARVAALLANRMNALPDLLKNSITWDRGHEMARHAEFTTATNMPVYFCDPYSPWQRGTNENTNGLLRQYLPKSTDLSGYTQTELDAIADELNDRPRKTLGWLKPTEVLNKLPLEAGDALTT